MDPRLFIEEFEPTFRKRVLDALAERGFYNPKREVVRSDSSETVSQQDAELYVSGDVGHVADEGVD